jgi:hypothetical protein
LNLIPLAVAAAIAAALGIWFRPGSKPSRTAGANPVVVDELWLIAGAELVPPVVSIRPSRAAKLRIISAGDSDRKLEIPSLGISVPVQPGRTMTVDLTVGKPGTAEILLDRIPAGLIVVAPTQSR